MYSSYGSSSSSGTTTLKYRIKFGGRTIETTVTNKAAIANEWATEMLSKYAGKDTVVGLDNEWRPNFSPYRGNKTATLQLCIDDRCLIVQLFYLDEIPQTLKTFLANPNFIFVGVEVAEDILKLKNEYRLVCNRSADIRDVAKSTWPGRYSRPGLKDLAKDICGLYMPKPKHVCMSNWEARVLSESQVEYACIDAYASYKIGHKLLMEM
ncbi:3'-5' exonuclease-like [Nicotiana tomentosiformis]|uniref:3'-5' exonuclease-like n=1 Tax=Nicotiana tomentosiformis TaxID=4098 RepID=UPI00051BD290|nr:Werner Syndrome-like exonuclease [Nicotiana tomentosiformis]